MSDLFAGLKLFWKLEPEPERLFRLNGFDDSRETDVSVDLVAQLSGQAEKRRLELVSEIAWFGC